MTPVRWLTTVLLAGWIADALASTDRDVEVGIEAYRAEDHARALEHFDAAIERRGDRPELSFDRGLALLGQEETDAARNAFERASEAEDPGVRASAFYELGNLDFDAEQWDAAVEHYIEALKARPDHANAKWNLELALKRKQEQEEQKQDEQEQDEQEQDEQEQDEQEQDEQEQDEQEQDEQEQDEQEQGTDGEPPPDEGSSGEPQESPETDGESTGGAQPEGTGGEQPPDPSESSEHEEDDSQPPAQQPAQPKPLDEMDIGKALDQLDQQDGFLLDRPRGRIAPPARDW